MDIKKKVFMAAASGVFLLSIEASAIRFEPAKGYYEQVRHVCVIKHSVEGTYHTGSAKQLKYAQLNARTRCQYVSSSDGCTHNNMTCEERDVFVKRAW